MSKTIEERVVALESWKVDQDGMVEATNGYLRELNSEFASQGRRLDAMDRRLGDIDDRFNNLDRRMTVMDERFNGVNRRLETLDSKLDVVIEILRPKTGAN